MRRADLLDHEQVITPPELAQRRKRTAQVQHTVCSPNAQRQAGEAGGGAQVCGDSMLQRLHFCMLIETVFPAPFGPLAAVQSKVRQPAQQEGTAGALPVQAACAQAQLLQVAEAQQGSRQRVGTGQVQLQLVDAEGQRRDRGQCGGRLQRPSTLYQGS